MYCPTKIQWLHPHGTILASIYSEIYLTTLRTFFTMATDDVLPFSGLLSDDLLQFFDDYESSSSTTSLTIAVPAPLPEMDSACNTLPPPSSVDVLSDKLKLFLIKGSATVSLRGKLSLT